MRPITSKAFYDVIGRKHNINMILEGTNIKPCAFQRIGGKKPLKQAHFQTKRAKLAQNLISISITKLQRAVVGTFCKPSGGRRMKPIHSLYGCYRGDGEIRLPFLFSLHDSITQRLEGNILHPYIPTYTAPSIPARNRHFL